MLFVIGWLVLLAVLGAFVANPFRAEVSAAATPDYARVMYLHGLLIGMVGLLALLACQVLRLRSLHARMWITGGVVVATVLSALGGIWDNKIPGAEVPMWTQILSFFALDEILIVLLVALVAEWRAARMERSLPYVTAFLAAASMLAAAAMGHLAGWIMEFGNAPQAIGNYATFAGIGTVADFATQLVGSHSHLIAVSVMALAIVLVAQQFGYATLRGTARALSRVGLSLVAIGTVVTLGMYVVAGFTTWAPPTWFVSGPDGANGIASDDIISGILVMGGGLLIVAALALGRADLLRQPLRVAALWSWVLSFATVVVAGYAIEMNEAYFGAGDATAPGGAKDAVFTWLHQDIGLFLLPALVVIMLAATRLINRERTGFVGWATILGTTITFAGGMLYVFVDPATYGIGYAVSTIGLLIVGIALLATLWWGIIETARPAAPTGPGASPLRRTAPLRQTMPPAPKASTPAEREKVPAGAR
jgi:hypothetical protein